MRLHWYPWDPAAFAMSTMRWNYEEKGYYRDALDLSWTQDGLEDVGWLPERVQRKFEQSPDGRWRNARQERDRAEQVEKHQRRSSAGSKGGRPKSNALALDNQCLSNDKALPNQSLSIGKAMAKQNESNQNQNQISSIEEKNTPLPPRGESAAADEVKAKPVKSVTYSDDFNAFWSIYPRKEGKGAAWESWKIRKSPVPDIEAVLPALRRAMNSQQWTKDGGRFIPHPATWINQRRWEDGGIETSGDSASTAASYL